MCFRNRVLHLIRHAESEFNVLANHQTEGFVPIVTKLDANLTENGFNQAKRLGQKIQNEIINGYHPSHPLSPKNAEIVITSPLSRAILTASHSLPFEQYQYIVRPEVSEQIENTTDIPVSKSELLLKFPYLNSQISSLPECWWYRHPTIRNGKYSPQMDADLLHTYNGQEPASESKELLKRRVKWFFKWLYNKPQIQYNNIVIYSHCCTIFEMEKYLRELNIDNENEISMPKNTEVRSFQLIQNENNVLNNQHIMNEFENYNDQHLWSNFEGYYVPIETSNVVQL
eukprot:315531_1